MNNRFTEHIIKISLTAALFLTAAALLCVQAGAEAGITVTDMSGRTVSIGSPAVNVISLSPAGCEIMNSIGAAGLLCGRSEACDYPDEILGVPVIGTGGEADLSLLKASAPDLILAGSGDMTAEQADELTQEGISVVFCEAQDVEGTFDAVRMVGKLTGKEDIAGYVVEGMLSTLEILESSAEHLEGEPQSVLFLVASPEGTGTLMTAGSGTLLNTLSELVGLENVFGDMEGFCEITAEEVAQRDPDHIVSVAPDNRSTSLTEEEILAEPGWADVKAVKEGSVRTFTGFEMCRPGPRLPEGAVMLYQFAYGAEDDPSL